MSVHNKFYFMMAIMRPPYQIKALRELLVTPKWAAVHNIALLAETNKQNQQPVPEGTHQVVEVLFLYPNQGHVPSHVKLLVTPKWVVVYNIVLLAETNKQDQQLVPVGTKVVEVNLSPHQGHVPSHVSVAIHAMQVRPRCPLCTTGHNVPFDCARDFFWKQKKRHFWPRL